MKTQATLRSPAKADRTASGTPIVDVLGVGFGPANLSLAVLLEEADRESQLSRVFLEARPSHAWHPGMLIEDSLLQVTVIKDLVTIENPQSRFTFLCYLKEKGRLYDFLNLRDLFPTRLEFNDYLGWAADELAASVRYGHRVRQILPADEDGRPIDPQGGRQQAALVRVEADRVESGRVESGSTGETAVFLARNLVLATGGVPTVPPGVELGAKAFHSHGYVHRIAEQFPDRDAPYRFLVVGSGQSGAEIFLDLIKRYPNADVTSTIRRFAMKPVDESDFTNRVFYPEWVDFYNGLPDEKRRAFFEDLKDVNYAVIDHYLIRAISKTLYQQKVRGRERARIEPFLELRQLTEKADGTVEARFENSMTEASRTLEVDGAVLCTGYDWPRRHPLLAALSPYFAVDDLGGFRVARDYRIESADALRPRVFLQGYCEDTHGISETVLSLLPVRARWIEQSVLAGRKVPAAALS